MGLILGNMNTFSYGIPTPDFEDNYTTNAGWTQVSTTVTVDSGIADKMAMVATPANGTARVHKSMSLTLSDTKWIARFTLNLATLGNDFWGGIMFTAGTLVFEGVQDGLGLLIRGASTPKKIDLIASDGGSITSGTSTIEATIALHDIQIERTSATNLKLSVFSDASFTTHEANSPVNFTIPSTVIGLTTIQHGVVIPSLSSPGDATMDGDDAKVWDNKNEADL